MLGAFFVILDLVLVSLVRGKKCPVYSIKTVPLKSFFSDRVSITAFEGQSKELVLKC